MNGRVWMVGVGGRVWMALSEAVAHSREEAIVAHSEGVTRRSSNGCGVGIKGLDLQPRLDDLSSAQLHR
jgi:hypothetical protein